ncbi:MAG: hypothetical protein AAGK02_06640 [Pseudomonadota bacterium]
MEIFHARLLGRLIDDHSDPDSALEIIEFYPSEGCPMNIGGWGLAPKEARALVQSSEFIRKKVEQVRNNIDGLLSEEMAS